MINCHFMVYNRSTLGFALRVPQVPAVGEIVVFQDEGGGGTAYAVTDVEWWYKGFHHFPLGMEGWLIETAGCPEGNVAAMVHIEPTK